MQPQCLKNVDELNELASLHQDKRWVCGPIQTGKSVQDYIPRDAVAYAFVMYAEPKIYEPGEAQYTSISGSFYYVGSTLFEG